MDKYVKSLDYIKKYLITKIEPKSIFIHGSYAIKPLFNKGFSDIDIIVIVDELNEDKACNLINIINGDKKNNVDKPPMYMNDNIARRIELYIEYEGVKFDITIMDNSWQDKEIINGTCYDSFEILLGIFDKYNISLYGITPERLIHPENHNFYPDSLRKKRLDILADRINRYTIRLDDFLQKKNDDMFDFALRLRNLFIKYLFIYYKKYPISLNKHLSYQFENILNLSKEEIKILLFKEGTLENQIKLFNNLVKKYLR